MAITLHEIDDLPVSKTPVQGMLSKLKIVAILSTLYMLYHYFFGKEEVGFIHVIGGVLLITGLSLLPIAIYTSFKSTLSGFNFFGHKETKKWLIQSYLNTKGFDINMTADTAGLMVDEQKRCLFVFNDYQKLVKEIPFDDIRSWEGVQNEHKTTGNTRQRTFWIYLGVTDVAEPTVKIQFAYDKEIEEWLERIDIWVNHQ